MKSIKLVTFVTFQAAIHCFITRLPCIWFGNFRYRDNVYVKGTINQTLDLVTRDDCGTACVRNPACIIANYNNIERKCELLSEEYTTEANYQWTLLRTNSSFNKKTGPLCEEVDPCLSDDWCRDVCTSNNLHTFTCMGGGNVALYGKALQSSDYLTNGAKFAIDGNYSTVAHTLIDPINWIKIDLIYVYPITQIVIFNRIANDYQLIGYNLMVGLKDDQQLYKQVAVLTADLNQVYVWFDNVQFVLITKVPSINQYLHIRELEVWV